MHFRRLPFYHPFFFFLLSHPNIGTFRYLFCGINYNVYRMKKSTLIFTMILTAAALAVTACTDTYIPEPGTEASGGKAIGFSVSVAAPGGRAAVAVADTLLPLLSEAAGQDASVAFSAEPVEAGPDSRAAEVTAPGMMGHFGVFAHRTRTDNVKEFYIHDSRVNLADDGSCTMADRHEWPEDKSVLRFYAYWPYLSEAVARPSQAGDAFSLGYTVPADMGAQHDLMVAQSVDFAGDAYTSVPLTFRHLCTQVTVRLAKGLADFRIDNVSFTGIEASGSYDYASGWTLAGGQGSSFTGAYADAADGVFTFMMLPQQTSSSARLTVSVHNHISGKDETYYLNLGQNWPEGYRVTYEVRLVPEFDLEFVSEAQLQDAHYVIMPCSIRAQDIAVGWTVESADSWATVRTSLTDLQQQGFWIVDDRGAATAGGAESVKDIPVYVFLEENTTAASRTGTLKLYPTGYPEAARTFTYEQLPVYRMAGGLGFERFEDDFGVSRLKEPTWPFGFLWDRYVTYTSSDFFYRLIIHWSAQDAISNNNASAYVKSTYQFLRKTTVTIDYKVLNDLGDTADDDDTGVANSWGLYNTQGIGTIAEIEDVFDGWGIQKDTAGGKVDLVQRYAAKVAVMKNKFTKETKTQSSGGTEVEYDVPVIKESDIVWYLPVAAEYSLHADMQYPLSGTYWTSRAIDDNVNAVAFIAGSGAGAGNRPRTDEYRIRCARK